jgi:hypothetical protein
MGGYSFFLDHFRSRGNQMRLIAFVMATLVLETALLSREWKEFNSVFPKASGRLPG